MITIIGRPASSAGAGLPHDLFIRRAPLNHAGDAKASLDQAVGGGAVLRQSAEPFHTGSQQFDAALDLAHIEACIADHDAGPIRPFRGFARIER